MVMCIKFMVMCLYFIVVLKVEKWVFAQQTVSCKACL